MIKLSDLLKEIKPSTKIKNAYAQIDNLPKGKVFDDAKNIQGVFNISQYSWSEVIENFEKNKEQSIQQSINISDISITQPNIQSNKAKQIITNIDKTPVINVVQFPNGEKVIYDGHHRLIANWALGKKSIIVNLVTLKNKLMT
jgi:hypothetical protein